MYVGILQYAGRRYLWWALLLVTASLVLYFDQSPAAPPSGGTWQGYTLGGIGAALIVWLSWLGIRKRRYRRVSGRLEGWASAHVYLGLTLPVVVTLHCAFQFGVNIHTLAYVLLAGVIASGAYGLYAYLRFPNTLVANRGNQSTGERLAEIEKLDKAALEAAGRCDEDIHALVNSAIERTSLGQTFTDQLLARDRSQVVYADDSKKRPALTANLNQAIVIDVLTRKIPDATKAGEVARLRQLLYAFGRRAEILQRLRREVAISLRLKLWLRVHIPLAIALLVALIAHVASVFFYW